MIKQILLLISLFTLFYCFTQQEINVDWSQPFPIKVNKYSGPAPRILGQANDQLYISSLNADYATINVLDSRDLVVTKSQKLPKMAKTIMGLPDRAINVELFNNSIIYWYKTLWAGLQYKVFTYSSVTLNKESEEICAKHTMIQNRTNDFNYYYSDDKVFILKRNSYSNNLNLHDPSFEGFLCDKSGNVLKNQTTDFPFERFIVENAILGNDNVIYILGFSYEIDKDRPKLLSLFEDHSKYPPGKFVVLKWNLKNNELITSEINMEGNVIYDIDFKMHDNKIKVVGFSSNGDHGFNTIFYSQFELNYLDEELNRSLRLSNDLIFKTWTESDRESFTKSNNKRDQKGEKREEPHLKDFDNLRVLFDDENSVYLTSQEAQASIEVENKEDNPISQTVYNRFGQVLALKFDSAFNLRWNDLIMKNQFSKRDRGIDLSYFAFHRAGNLYVLYNNYSKYDDLLFRSRQFIISYGNLARLKGKCYLVKIDDNGDRGQETTIKSATEKAKLLPVSSYMMKSGKLMLMCRDGNKYFVGTIGI